jgi:hypothetical protein
LFFTDIPIDPEVLRQEHKFQVRHQGLQHVRIEVEKEGEEEEGEEEEGEEEEGEEEGVVVNGEGLATPARSVASLDSIAAGADFIEFE